MDYQLKQLRDQMNRTINYYLACEQKPDFDSMELDLIREKLNESKAAFFSYLKEMKARKKLKPSVFDDQTTMEYLIHNEPEKQRK